jgi:hypothetical protein
MGTRPDLGGLDGVGDNKTYSNGALVSGKANGAVSFAGALGSLSYIESAAEVPVSFFHSSDDNTVPFNSGEPFSTLSWLPGFNLPTVFGGNALNNRCATVGAKKELNAYTNRGHNVHVTGSNLYSDIASKTSQFLYNNFLMPSASRINGNTVVCNSCPPETYVLNDFSTKTDWTVTGGKVINAENNIVTIQWDNDASEKSITANPYSSQLAKGESIVLKLNNNHAPVVLKNLNLLSTYKNINLNDYFVDVEGTKLSFSVHTANGAESISSELNGDLLSLTALNQDLVIEAKDANNCKTSQIITAKAINSSDFVAVSPNPFGSEFAIKFDFDLKSETLVEIIDMNGRIVFTKNISPNSLTNNLSVNEIKSSGIYVLKITNNEINFEQKIVKN